MNEAVVRSPKWLRNFLDFELHTGQDIEGKISKKEKKRLDAEAKLREEERQRQSKIREEEKQKEEQKRINKQLDDLFNSIVSDFNKNRFDDKYWTTSDSKGNNIFHFRFENGEEFKLDDNKITYGGYIYTISPSNRFRFTTLANEIIRSKAWSRPKSSNSYSSGNRERTTYSKTRTTSGDPKYDQFKKIKDTVAERERQLSKMPKTDPDYNSYKNDLDNARNMLKRMKDKYKFENLKNFFDYQKV